MSRTGEVYCITNTINGKVYIGQALTPKCGRSASRKRFNSHVHCALNNKADSPYLNNAIRKYGREAFILEVLIQCNEEELDNYEKMFIKQYESQNSKYGYNILGGGQRDKEYDYDEPRMKESSKKLSQSLHKFHEENPDAGTTISSMLEKRWSDPVFKEETLNKIMTEENIKAKIEGYLTKTLPIGIFEIYHGDTLAGYRAQVQVNGNRHTKTYIAGGFTLEEKLSMAINGLKELREEYEHLITYKADSHELPKGIHYAKRNGKVVGYVAQLVRNGKKLAQTFGDTKIPMEIKYQQALAKLEEFILTGENSSKKKRLEDLPANVYQLNRNGELVGYIVRIEIDNKEVTKTFGDSNLSLDEKRKMAIDSLNELLAIKKPVTKAKSGTKDLPVGIAYRKDKNGEPIGYTVQISLNKRKKSASFSSKKLSMEVKYSMALQELEKFKKELQQ